jgi:hypothetical protein
MGCKAAATATTQETDLKVGHHKIHGLDEGAGGFADDQFSGDFAADWSEFAVPVGGCDGLEQDAGTHGTHGFHGLADGGERRHGESSLSDVVETNHRTIFGNT